MAPGCEAGDGKMPGCRVP